MKIEELKRDNFSAFASLTDEYTRLNQINAVKYIEHMAALSNTDIRNWDIKQVFADQDKEGLLIVSKTELNKRLFAHKERVEQKVDALKVLSPKDLDDLKKIAERVSSELKKKALRRLEEHKDNAESYQREVDKHMALARKAAAELEIYNSGKLKDISGDICKVVEKGFFKYDRIVDGKVLRLTTINDVVLTHKDNVQLIDMSLNLGSFAVEYHLIDGRVTVKAAGRNRFYNDLYHPHLSSYGEVCWGGARQNAVDALASGDIVTLCDLIAYILSAYNVRDAYVNLVNLRDHGRSREEWRQQIDPLAISLEQYAYALRPRSTTSRASTETTGARWEAVPIQLPDDVIADELLEQASEDSGSVEVDDVF